MRVVVVGAAAATLVVTTPGCFGDECKGDVYPQGTEYGLGMEGDMVDPDTWESVALDEKQVGEGHYWMDFPAHRTWRVAVPKWIDGSIAPRPIAEMHGYVSLGPRPNLQVYCGGDHCDAADNWTEGSGNILEFTPVGNGRVHVTNDTCTHFYLRLVLRAAPAVDAGLPDAQSGQAR
jgi:hypothetical protein